MILYTENVLLYLVKRKQIMINIKRITVLMAIIAILSLGTFALEGSGTKDAPYTIASLADLQEMALMSLDKSFDGVYFSQTSDITVNDDSIITGSGNVFICAPSAKAIYIGGNSTKPFMGNYNGNGYKISGLYLPPSEGNSALFVYTENATISNLVIDRTVVEGGKANGGIVGIADGTTVISNCSFTGTLLSSSTNRLNSCVGGIAGKVRKNAVIDSCTSNIYFPGTANAPFAAYYGGIAGDNQGTITKCESYGELVAVSDNYAVYLGGIAGSNEGEILGSTNNAVLSGSIADEAALLYIGGISGINNGGTIQRTVNTADISATGYNQAPGYVGGITGFNSDGTVEVSKNNGEIEGSLNYAGGVSGVNLSEQGISSVKDCLNTGSINVNSGIIGGLVGGNISNISPSASSQVSSSMNLADTKNGNAAIGSVETDNIGISDINGLIVKNSIDNNAITMTVAELLAADKINVLKSSAWVYPKNGYLPELVIAKDLSKSEIITMNLDKSANKAAAVLYSTEPGKPAVAIVSFFTENRLLGVKIAPITLTEEYTVFTVESNLVSSAKTVNVMVLDSLSGLIPAAELVSFK